jgi:hypothetical protein
MNYRKNPDNTYTAFKYMKFDGTMLEVTANDLDNAKSLLKQEIEAWKTYGLEEAGTFYSPGSPDNKGIVYARDDLAELIKKENKENENSKNT